MKSLIIFLLITCSNSISAQQMQISWEKDLFTATELAKTQNKPILVYFQKSDCQECQDFYLRIFKSDQFSEFSKNYIFLMVDGDNSDTKSTDMEVIKQRRLLLHYNKTQTFPALLVLDKEGNTLSDLMSNTDDASISSYLSILENQK